MMAIYDQRPFVGAGFEILKFAGYRAHGDQRRAVDFGLSELVRFADVDQMKFFTRVETPFDFLGFHFEGRCSHHTPS